MLATCQKAHSYKFECALQVVQQHGKEVNATSLGAMPYADATIKEALRFIAIVTAVGRKALKTFEVGGYTIPKASTGRQQAAQCNILDFKTKSASCSHSLACSREEGCGVFLCNCHVRLLFLQESF